MYAGRVWTCLGVSGPLQTLRTCAVLLCTGEGKRDKNQARVVLKVTAVRDISQSATLQHCCTSPLTLPFLQLILAACAHHVVFVFVFAFVVAAAAAIVVTVVVAVVVVGVVVVVAVGGGDARDGIIAVMLLRIAVLHHRYGRTVDGSEGNRSGAITHCLPTIANPLLSWPIHMGPASLESMHNTILIVDFYVTRVIFHNIPPTGMPTPYAS